MTTNDPEYIEHMRRLLQIHRHSLANLEALAKEHEKVPPHLANQIDYVRQQIAICLAALKATGSL